MSFDVKKQGDVTVIDVEGQLIVGNRQELKQKVLEELEGGARKFLIDFSIVFGMVIMPFTYYPILTTAGDRNLMGKHANGKAHKVVGWMFLGLITIASIAAIPPMVLTRAGKP